MLAAGYPHDLHTLSRNRAYIRTQLKGEPAQPVPAEETDET